MATRATRARAALFVIGVGALVAACTPTDATSTPPPAGPPVVAGSFHTCAINTSGGAVCWGKNGSGQLGNGTLTDSSTPVPVSGLASGVASISMRYSSTCAVTTAGAAKCWGDNAAGELGNGTFVNSSVPVTVSGLAAGVASIAVDYLHTCAVLSSGAVQCWGDNTDGELGNASFTDASTPVAVLGLSSGVTTVVAGNLHSCALLSSGAVQCWGKGTSGELGNGSNVNHSSPVGVTGLGSGVTSLSSTWSHSCVLTTAGGVKCWGANLAGQLGDGTTTGHTVPVDVTGLTSGVTAVAAGGLHTCALTTVGGVKCWGYNAYGGLGDNTLVNRSTAADVTGLTSGVTEITAGGYHTCAVRTGGSVTCWGYDASGQLGNHSTADSKVPVTVAGLNV